MNQRQQQQVSVDEAATVNYESKSNPWAGLVLGVALCSGAAVPAIAGENVGTSSGASPQVFSNTAERRGLQLGDRIPDITVPDREGRDFTLSKALGERLILVDFWASWCAPCRQENPNVVNAYKRFKDSNFVSRDGTSLGRGFEVISISVDTERDEWLSAITADKLTWSMHGRDSGWSRIGKIYGVKSIPSNLLVDKDGRIVAKNLRGRALSDFLEKIRERK